MSEDMDEEPFLTELRLIRKSDHRASVSLVRFYRELGWIIRREIARLLKKQEDKEELSDKERTWVLLSFTRFADIHEERRRNKKKERYDRRQPAGSSVGIADNPGDLPEDTKERLLGLEDAETRGRH